MQNTFNLYAFLQEGLAQLFQHKVVLFVNNCIMTEEL